MVANCNVAEDSNYNYITPITLILFWSWFSNQTKHLCCAFPFSFFKMDSDCQTKWEFGCNARPLGRIKCLSSWVTWSSSSRTRAPRCRMMVRCVIRVSSMGFLPKGLQLHSQVLPQNAQITIFSCLTGKHRIWGGPIIQWTKHSSGVDGALFA